MDTREKLKELQNELEQYKARKSELISEQKLNDDLIEKVNREMFLLHSDSGIDKYLNSYIIIKYEVYGRYKFPLYMYLKDFHYIQDYGYRLSGIEFHMYPLNNLMFVNSNIILKNINFYEFEKIDSSKFWSMYKKFEEDTRKQMEKTIGVVDSTCKDYKQDNDVNSDSSINNENGLKSLDPDISKMVDENFWNLILNDEDYKP